MQKLICSRLRVSSLAPVLLLLATGCETSTESVVSPEPRVSQHPALSTTTISDDSAVYTIGASFDVDGLSDDGAASTSVFQCPRSLTPFPPAQPLRFVYPQPGGSNWSLPLPTIDIPGSGGSISFYGTRVPTSLYRVLNPGTSYSTDGLWGVRGDFTIRAACHMTHVKTFIPPNRVIDVWDGFYVVYQFSGNFFRTQSACNGTGGGGSTALVSVVDPGYDPYASIEPYNADGDCESGTPAEGGGSTDEGSGTQYQPGDSTGGETVDWGTGVGNGGSSACGSTAIVAHICIDVWVEGVGWVEWSCGYATTC